MIVAVVLGLSMGLLFGFTMDIDYPSEYSFYITMGLLAALDSVIGACRSMMEKRFDSLIFFSGFVTNALLAMMLTYLGDRLGVPLYLATIFVFGGRLFNNFAIMRRMAIDEYRGKIYKEENIKVEKIEENIDYK